MAFWGHEFIFDDVSCNEHGLVVYSFDSTSQEDVTIAGGEIIEDKIASRYDSIAYGVVQNKSLEYTLVFGANIESLDEMVGINRYEIEAVSAWLLGHSERKWLSIIQDDMDSFRYKCFITDLKVITDGMIPYAFSCKVICDSPFAYTFPEESVYTVSGSRDIRFFNQSSYNGYYKPVIEVTVKSGTEFSITNKSDNNRVFKFSSLPSSNLKIKIDNKNQIITNDMDLNLYPNFNMKFFRLLRGDNFLNVSGDVDIKFICEYPVNIGG